MYQNRPEMPGLFFAQVEVVLVLAEQGADFEERNKQGLSIWDFAVAAEESDLLIATIMCYKNMHRMYDKFLMPSGKSPLHSAALKGMISSLCLLGRVHYTLLH